MSNPLQIEHPSVDLPAASAPHQRRTGRIHAAALPAYLVLTFIMTWPLITQLATAIPGDSFDGWQNFWNLWWVKTALLEQQRTPLFTDLLFHPTGVSLYFHTLNPFNGVVTLPVQLSFGLIPAYNAAVLLAWALGGYGVFLLTFWALGSKDLSLKIGERAPSITHAAPDDRELMTDHSSSTIFNLPSVILSLRYAAAFLAGVIFTFSPFHMAHLLGHMQVMSFQWMPFYILYLLRALSAVKIGASWRRDALMAALFLVLVGLCDWYFVLYLVLFTGLAIVWSWLGTPRQAGGSRGRLSPLGELVRLTLPALTVGALFFAALSFWLVPMIRETRQFSFMVRPATDLYILSASVMDFLVPNRLHPLFRPESFTWIGNQIVPVSERTISIGYVALAAAIWGALAARRQAGLWTLGAIFFFFMALGPVIHLGNITEADIPAVTELPLHFTPFGILAYFSDFVRLSRSVSRYAVMVQLCVAVLAGFGVAMAGTRLRIGRLSADSSGTAGAEMPDGRTRRQPGFILWPMLLGLILILAEYWVAPFPMSPPDTPDWYATPAQEPGEGAVLNLPMNYDRPGYLLYQTVHQRPLTVAYISRDDPRTLTERAPVLQHFRHLGADILVVDPPAIGMTVLHDLGVEYVVLDRYKMPGGLERTYTTDLAAAIFADHAPVYEDDRITVFRVEPPAAPQAYPVLGALNWGALDQGPTTSARAVAGPTAVEVFHAPTDAKLRIRYRTGAGTPDAGTPDAGIAAALLDNGLQVELPPAPGGNEVILPLTATSTLESAVISIIPAASGQLWVEEIEVVLEE